MASGASSQRFRKPPPLYYGFPPYIWVTAGGTTLLIGYCYFAFLDTVPLTGRRRWIATAPATEVELGNEQYKQLLSQFRSQILPPTHPASKTVARVGSRIANASLVFAQQHNLTTYNPAPYTYTVIRHDMANAFVLPGNHIFVFTGLFKYARNEDELAGVIGHEVAHTLARHAGERISGNVLIQLLARITLLVDPSGALAMIFLPAAKLLNELPHSRTQETEADEIGVFLAAQACYDPRAAKRVFANMKEADGASPPEFLSTHPSHQSRISNFDKWLPDAMEIYQSDYGERCQSVRRQMEAARRAAAFGREDPY